MTVDPRAALDRLIAALEAHYNAVVSRKGEPEAPAGVATPVTEEQAAMLEQNPVFKVHKANGYVVITTDKPEPERMAADMNTGDKSKQLNPADFPDQNVTTNKQKAKT